MSITKATAANLPALVLLINSAYRGEESKKGWTTEASFLQGDQRIDLAALKLLLNNPEAVILKYTNDENIISGCVYLEKKERGLYLGMLTVSPLQQAAGIGKKLLTAAELYGKEKKCKLVFMNVISLRSELIAWYENKGYYQTQERNPFPDDNRFGIPTQPLEFIIMEKTI